MSVMTQIANYVAPMMRKLGHWVGEAAHALGPADLRASQSWRQMRSAIGTDNPLAIMSAGFMQQRAASSQFAAARAANPAIKKYGFMDWLKGATYQDHLAMASGAPTSAMMQAMQNRAMIRGGVLASIAAPFVFGSDSTLGGMASTARGIGMHATAATMLTPISPIAGAMYAGIAGVNMFRRGDNVGPF